MATSRVACWRQTTRSNPSSCANYYGNRINPSDTGNIRGQALFNVTDNVKLTFDPSFQYVLANGGGRNTLVETPLATAIDRRIIGASTTAMGFDVNGDGDLLDTVRVYTPNTTNTRRFVLTTSAIWDVTDTQRLRFAYTLDYGKHRQTAQWGRVKDNGDPEDVFAGWSGTPILAADGSEIRGRDRNSVAELNQIAAEYRGKFLDDALTLNVGVRAPKFTRELNQFCHTPDGGTGNSGNNPGAQRRTAVHDSAHRRNAAERQRDLHDRRDGAAVHRALFEGIEVRRRAAECRSDLEVCRCEHHLRVLRRRLVGAAHGQSVFGASSGRMAASAARCRIRKPRSPMTSAGATTPKA